MRRRGITLVEVLTVATVSTVLVSIAVGLLHALLRTDRAAREQVRWATTEVRLGEQFRRDVRQAVAARPGDDAPSSLDLTLPGQRKVRYRFEDGRLVRREDAGTDARREEDFALPSGATAAIEIHKGTVPFSSNENWDSPPLASGQRKTVSLVIESSGIVGPMLRIDAILARDHRFDKEP